jgi:hypothetical protein
MHIYMYVYDIFIGENESQKEWVGAKEAHKVRYTYMYIHY